jgi:xanthine dehydrogenase accessory factor
MRDILLQLQQWQASGQRIALASIIRTKGHAPREVGSTLAVLEDGSFTGSVSGGCLEATVLQAALDVLGGSETQLLSFGDEFETMWEAGLSCGGSVEVLVYELGEDIQDACEGRELEVSCKGEIYRIPLLEAQPLKLVCVGAVHIASELIKLASTLGYYTVVIDPRRPFITQERFPHADELICAWPQEALKSITLDANTALCALTHDTKIDTPAVMGALTSDAFYIGALGRPTTQTKRAQSLIDQGVDPASLKRICGPIGLNLGGKAPEELALSIMAQITATRYGRDATSHRMYEFIS